MGLSLRGTTSGAVDINAPAVAGDNTITLPNGNGSANQFFKNSDTAGIITHSSMTESSSGVISIGDIDIDGTTRTITTGVGQTVGFSTDIKIQGSVRIEDPSVSASRLAITYQGIDFQNTGAGSSTGAISHLLDDYEEGTWEPKALGGATGFTTSRCFYTKIGSQVNLYYSGAIIGGNAGRLRIVNLPFVSDTTTNTGTQTGVECVGSVMLNIPSLPAGVSGSLVCYVWSSEVNIYMTRQGAGWEALDGDEAGNNMIFTVTYKAIS